MTITRDNKTQGIRPINLYILLIEKSPYEHSHNHDNDSIDINNSAPGLVFFQ